MANAIQMVDEGKFQLQARGCDMTLVRISDGWEMYTVNAMVSTYRRGYAIPKFFRSLEEVEAKYKSWRGISALVS
jgi:hypothetical protein